VPLLSTREETACNIMDYSKVLSSKVQQIKPSGIRKFFDMLEGMEGVVALTVGQPDFVTPWHIRDAAIECLQHGKTYYTSNRGMPALCSEISKYEKNRIGVEYDPGKEIVVTVGGSEAIDIAIRAMIDEGDEAIVTEPCFVCYSPMVSLAGGVPVSAHTKVENKFKLTPELLRSKITDRTKLLILSYPNNPTGAIMTREDLEKIAEVIRETNIVVISDEIYGELTYGERHVSIASLPGMRERTIVVNGFSKAFAMTGWRLGYLMAPAELATQMIKIHQYAIMCAPTMSQFAAIEALANGSGDVEMMRDEYNRRRRLIVDGLNKLGLTCFEPEGAFYVYPYIGGYGLSSEEFCDRLLKENKVAIVPGTAFSDEGEGFARISYAYSVKHITEALEHIEQFLEKLKREQ
jgi:aminotransferase